MNAMPILQETSWFCDCALVQAARICRVTGLGTDVKSHSLVYEDSAIWKLKRTLILALSMCFFHMRTSIIRALTFHSFMY